MKEKTSSEVVLPTEKVSELLTLCTPVTRWLEANCMPHSKLILTNDDVKLVVEEISVRFQRIKQRSDDEGDEKNQKNTRKAIAVAFRAFNEM